MTAIMPKWKRVRGKIGKAEKRKTLSENWESGKAEKWKTLQTLNSKRGVRYPIFRRLTFSAFPLPRPPVSQFPDFLIFQFSC
jgi:hypothetical protein